MLTREQVFALENLKSAGARLTFAVPEAKDFVEALNDVIGNLILNPRMRAEEKSTMLKPTDFLYTDESLGSQRGSQNWGDHE